MARVPALFLGLSSVCLLVFFCSLINPTTPLHQHGKQTSIAGRDCLVSALGGNTGLVAFQDQLLYQTTAVHEYNLNIPVTPAAITYPETSEQIAAVVKCASEYDYKVQARSGGHSFGNYGLGGADGAVVVDMKHFTQFSMDEQTYEAVIGPGTTLGDVDTELYNNGKRAMAHGICPTISTGGHFTMGGLGPTARQWGLALDHVEEVEVVLANSSIVRASNTQNQEVFFAVKGAAASFGIVTEFKVRTQPAPGLAVQYSYTFNLGSSAEKAQFVKDWQSFISAKNLTRQFYTNMVIFDGNIILEGLFFGSKEQYEALGLEDRFVPKNPGNILVLTDWLGMVGHALEDTILRLVGNTPTWFYAKSLGFTPDTLIPSSGIDEFFDYIENNKAGTLTWFVTLSLEGGAINDVPKDATAYGHRDVLFWVQIFMASPTGPVSSTTYDFADGLYNVLTKAVPESEGHAYLGCPDPKMADAQQKYWRQNLPRLEELKATLDPKDTFHNPQGILPA
ncbi:putative glucooligosaccharide oxidase [Aspergillus nomiae NRRL 13137]|uniref:Putative glucooligosaccharide oxidase n=1 Tax=Aspergillus nomiae NRRL (strain ATCC 15546 / NRRL 13137 / CBS 260.88 / M93) TaxID=1509407 RepID=A0A0L1J4J1_ASPN3|nr:putative glucooligosaccharide oxidase [Aspergillus nomiae NRRL 13137]KNG86343.1 putative glucooligosaccharide oxidase [Aspergillus nomiae NRRL 13137]